MFADHVHIILQSGKGGDGAVSFRREKYIPNGGPDGGDGGKGGDIIFEVDKGMNTLSTFRHKRKYAAQNGEIGGKRKCHGRNGEDLIVKVPEGTIIKEKISGRIIADMSHHNARQIILRGGKGGYGNMNFATSTMQAPRYAKPGKPGIELEVTLELKIIADVGLVGFPNVGKSTLLSRLTNAKPEIANYHFTTLVPNLGVVDLSAGHGFVIADIPGLIEGASEGLGLGLDFLRHIDRTKVIVHVVDGAGVEGRNPIEDIESIIKELSSYNIDILNKPAILVANKIDAIYSEDNHLDALEVYAKENKMPFMAISAVSGEGLEALKWEIDRLLKTVPEEPISYEAEFDPEELRIEEKLSYTVTKEKDVYVVEGPAIEKMLGYTNLESEKGFIFFQKFLKDRGILAELEALGIQDKDVVRLYGFEFEYYK